MPTVYCISGLGADEHIFDRLELPGFPFHYLSWLMPEGDEPLGTYAKRMQAGIATDQPILLGVSFGGMMAIEIARHLPSATVILVSSIQNRHQLPLLIRSSVWFGLGRWSPRVNLPILSPFEDYFLGVETPDDARLVRNYRGNVDPKYLQWSIRHIAGWRNEWKPERFYHLHGGRDRIFPLKMVQPTHIVKSGGHLMIYNRPEEVSRILQGILAG